MLHTWSDYRDQGTLAPASIQMPEELLRLKAKRVGTRYLVLLWAHLYSAADEEGKVFITIQDVADTVGCKRRCASYGLETLRDNGFISTKRGYRGLIVTLSTPKH